jgi:hypothetical protein
MLTLRVNVDDSHSIDRIKNKLFQNNGNQRARNFVYIREDGNEQSNKQHTKMTTIHLQKVDTNARHITYCNGQSVSFGAFTADAAHVTCKRCQKKLSAVIENAKASTLQTLLRA